MSYVVLVIVLAMLANQSVYVLVESELTQGKETKGERCHSYGIAV
jgi:hypothetical protein